MYESLKDIAIINNCQYTVGKFGDFTVVYNINDGYINLSALCRSGNKHFKDWNEIRYAKELLEAFKTDGSVVAPVYKLNRSSVKGLTLDEGNMLVGTYGHPKVAIAIATWISPKYMVHVTDIVMNYYLSKTEKELRDISDQLTTTFNNLCIKNEEVLELKESNTRKTDRFNRLKHRIRPELEDTKKHHLFILINKHISDDYTEVIRQASYDDNGVQIRAEVSVTGYTHYIVRIQRIRKTDTIGKLLSQYEQMEIVEEWIDTSNSINIGNKLKEKFNDDDTFTYKFNHIFLGDVHESDVQSAIDDVIEEVSVTKVSSDNTDEEYIKEE